KAPFETLERVFIQNRAEVLHWTDLSPLDPGRMDFTKNSNYLWEHKEVSFSVYLSGQPVSHCEIEKPSYQEKLF
ncbi:hypothetical protein ACQP3F_35035, partial [Escherichia coli]